MKWIRHIWITSLYRPATRICMHVGFWLAFCFYMRADSTSIAISPDMPYWVTLSGILLHILLFYPLVYGIIPMFKHRYWIRAGICVIIYFIVASTVQQYHVRSMIKWVNEGMILQFDGQHLWENLWESTVVTKTRAVLSNAVNLITIIFIPLSIKLLRDLWRASQQQLELSRKHEQLQLSFLKAQINPHMFFNTLNNLQSFIVHNEKSKSISLLTQLADFMRVSLYEINAEWIDLRKELRLMENYIAIQRVRFDEECKISVNICTDSQSCKIPPLLLLPFVENAFKYSSDLPLAEVYISLNINSDKDNIHFIISNRFSPVSTVKKGGLGLSNARSRIELYYPSAHTLNITQDSEIYTVDLTIPCR